MTKVSHGVTVWTLYSVQDKGSV